VKKKNKKDNVVEFVSESEESTDTPVNEEVEDSVAGGETSGENPLEDVEAPDELDILKQEKDKYYDLMLRKQAEFENYRKRVAREKQESINLTRMSLIKDVLPIMDACEKGLETLRNDDDNSQLGSYEEGYELLLKQLKSFLEKNSVSLVSGVGSVFDPNFHEAVLREVSEDHNDGEILEEYRRGYTMNDLLIRAAQVKVAVHPD
jgi:molecular chaperone GrpE